MRLWKYNHRLEGELEVLCRGLNYSLTDRHGNLGIGGCELERGIGFCDKRKEGSGVRKMEHSGHKVRYWLDIGTPRGI